MLVLNALILANPALKTQAGAENPTLALIGVFAISSLVPFAVAAILPSILLLFKRFRSWRSWLKLFFWIQLIIFLAGLGQVMKEYSGPTDTSQQGEQIP